MIGAVWLLAMMPPAVHPSDCLELGSEQITLRCAREEQGWSERTLARRHDRVETAVRERGGDREARELRRADELWIRYRAVHCASISRIMPARAEALRLDCERRLNDERADQLQRLTGERLRYGE